MPIVVRTNTEPSGVRAFITTALAKWAFQTSWGQKYLLLQLRKAIEKLNATDRHEVGRQAAVGKAGLLFIAVLGCIFFDRLEQDRRVERARERAHRALLVGEYLIRIVASRDCREELLGDFTEQFNIVLQENGPKLAFVFAVVTTTRNVAYRLKLRSFWTWLSMTAIGSAHHVWPALVQFLHEIGR